MKRICLTMCVLLFCLFLFSAPGLAQDVARRMLQDEKSDGPNDFPEIKEPLYFDFGFWHKFGVYHFEELGSWTSEHRRNLRIHSLYAWSEVILEKTHRVFARINTVSLDYSKGDGGLWDHKIYKPRLDLGFYEYRTEAKKGSDEPIKRFRFRLGRQLLQVGSGFTYSRAHDGLGAAVSLKPVDIEAFFAQSIPSEDNIDQTKPGNNRQRRNFYGLQASLKTLQNHTPYMYVLAQRDRQGEKFRDYTQNYIFHSNYYGFGAKGSVGKKVNYLAEYIIEQGKRHPDGLLFFFPLPKESINAYAFNSKVEYVLGDTWKSLLSFQYMFGSGDSDRLSPTDTIGGNEPFTSDATFVGFGHSETGYALYPMVSNLHVFRLNYSCMPFQHHETFKKMRIGASYITMSKHKRGGGISTRKQQIFNNKDVGWELDLYAQWEVYSDLLVTFKYGHYDPGNAFDSQQGMRRNLDYIYIGVTYSF